jgi:hypothetical protein
MKKRTVLCGKRIVLCGMIRCWASPSPNGNDNAPNQCWLVLGFSWVWLEVYELAPHSDLTLELNLMGLHGLKPAQELDLTSVKGFLQGLGHRVG